MIHHNAGEDATERAKSISNLLKMRRRQATQQACNTLHQDKSLRQPHTLLPEEERHDAHHESQGTNRGGPVQKGVRLHCHGRSPEHAHVAGHRNRRSEFPPAIFGVNAVIVMGSSYVSVHSATGYGAMLLPETSSPTNAHGAIRVNSRELRG